MMAKRPKKTKLQMLLEWPKRAIVDKMLDDGESPNKVAAWINEQGLEISVPTVYNYQKKRKEAIMKDVKLEQLIDKRKENGQNLKKAHSVKSKKAKKKALESKKEPDESFKSKIAKESAELKQGMSKESRKQYAKEVKRIKSEAEILDRIIDLGGQTLERMEVISPDMALKAIKLKHDLTGGEHNGLTVYGIEELRLREAALESALTAVMLKYVPEEQHEAMLTDMEKSMEEYYESIGMGDEYKRMVEMELAGEGDEV
ncbi:hypothetical protein [Bacillus subtilis]|uniref:hypothetical protein n=1 Tax=Bacillus subtilis TaxID=1423 RepID=UPI00295F0F46|nr:hypothetical protein [Bacillus subtilis]